MSLRSMSACSIVAALIASLGCGGVAVADPVPPPPAPTTPAPHVFCFRITDIRAVPGDKGNDRFQIEFESLNWSNVPAYGMYLLANTGHGAIKEKPPQFSGASIDADGRPLLKIDVNGDSVIDDADNEDGNHNGALDPGEDQNANGRLDNDPIPGYIAGDNDWSVAPPRTATRVQYRAGTPVPTIDLLSDPPTWPPLVGFLTGPDPEHPDMESVDDGPNALDGFVVEVDDFDVGEILSFNWIRTSENGAPIGTVGQGNPYGFGAVNIIRTDGSLPPGPPLEPPLFAGNTGFIQTANMFFDNVFNVPRLPSPAEFWAEFSAGITAPFRKPADNILCADANVGGGYTPCADTTPPTIRVQRGSETDIRTITDAGSGIASVVSSSPDNALLQSDQTFPCPPDRAPLPGDPPPPLRTHIAAATATREDPSLRPFTWTVTATDCAGNTSSRTPN